MPQPPYFLWDHWYIAARSHEVRQARATAVHLLDTRVALYRDEQGQVVALRDRCPHVGASLAQGLVKDGCISCPFHGWTFDATGSCVDIPALGEPSEKLRKLQVSAYPVREAAGLIWVYMTRSPGVVPTTDPVPPELLDRTWARVLQVDTWPVNYTRFVENMLDQVHLPYVHRGTIGRFSKARGPLEPAIEPTADGFVVGGSLGFILPNVHRLTISEGKMMNYMWGVPTRAEETRIYIVGLRRFARLRLLNPLFNFANHRVLIEDRPVVLAQEPRHVTYGAGGDMLLRPDTAARAYRALLAQLLDGEATHEEVALELS